MAIIHFNTDSQERIAYYNARSGKLKFRTASRQSATQPAGKLATASRMGKLIRTTFAAGISEISDPRHVKRLFMEMFQVISSGPKGISKLEGFEFNTRTALFSLLNTPPTTAISRSTGNIHVTVPPLRIPGSIDASHYQVALACGIINFHTGMHQTAIAPGSFIMLASTMPHEVQLQLGAQKADPDAVWMIALGLSFFSEDAGRYLPLSDRRNNALAIIAAV